MDSTGYEDFDIDRSTAQGWAEFENRLSDVISVIDDSADLVIGTESYSTDEGGPFVSFTAPRPDVVRAEAASNSVLRASEQLSAEDRKRLEESGWQQPGASATSTRNFWIECAQEKSATLAELAVIALRDVYGVPHPVFLAPDPLAEVLTPKIDDHYHPANDHLADDHPADDHHAYDDIGYDDIGYDEAAVSAVMPANRTHLDTLVDAELTDLFGHRPIRDAEGDIAIRVGSTMVFLRTTSDGAEIVIFAAVVHEIEGGRSHAAEVLNDLNCDARWVKFQLIRDRVFVTLSIPAKPFVRAHLRQAVHIMSDVADGIDNDLATKLRGRTTFDQSDPGS